MQQPVLRNIFAHAADAARRKHDAPAARRLKRVQNFFAAAPRLHEQIFKPKGIGQQAQIEQMAVNAVHFRPNHPQIARPRRDANIHQGLNALTIAPRVHERADAANAFDDIHALLKVFFLRDFFQPAMHVAEHGKRLDDFFVLQH